MDKMALYIGDKHLSSWSMRPWLLMKHFEMPFEERLVRLDQANTKDEISKISPSHKLPVLVDHDLQIWDSLSICEYLAEKFPRLNLWPDSTPLRAYARSVCSEMHSSFAALRKEAPMNLLKVLHEGDPAKKELSEAAKKELSEAAKKELSEAAKKDVARIDTLFHDCREGHKAKGAFLMGDFGIMDAYFMPVISRIRSYQLPIRQKGSVEYFNYIINSPLFKMWLKEAEKDLP